MKKFTLSVLFPALCFFALPVISFTQTRQQLQIPEERCGTMHWLQDMYRVYPSFKDQYQKNEKVLGHAIAEKGNTINGAALRTNAITIPVVFHIVLANPNSITNAMIQAQLDTLNKDFSGNNADSTKIPAAFKPFYGKGNIQFCLAQRTPANQNTTGIQRITSSVTSQTGVGDRIKYTAQGGADSWDPSKYVNVWVANFASSTILGYATFPIGTPENPGPFPVQEQGLVILAGGVPGGTAAPYNFGRTLTHEMGHYFWLRHISGDSPCGDDFPNTPGIDDTPQQSDQTYGCPPGVLASGCAASPNPPGRMYQNFMDYVDDRCMVMFTKGQNTRSEAALSTYRSSLITSNGCTPVPTIPFDASISAIINPLAGQALCGATSIAPIVTLTNPGVNTLTFATITVSLDGGPVTNYPWTGSLPTGAQINVNLNSVTGLSAGSHTLNVCVISPNGQTDGDASNNCKSIAFTIISSGSGGLLAPVFEGFESPTFPPAGWSVTPSSGSYIWSRTTAAAKSGIASAYVNIYNNTTIGRNDFLRSPSVSFPPTYSSAFLSFDYAYKRYSANQNGDTLEVLLSSDCGASFVSIFKRGGATLPTTSGFTGDVNWFPTAPEWTATPVILDISAYRSNAVIVQFRARNGYGENIFLDNINIYGTIPSSNDAMVASILSPSGEFCSSAVTPVVNIKNNGSSPLTSFKVNSRVDNGTLFTKAFTGLNIQPGNVQVFTLDAISGLTNGGHTFTAYTTEPNGQADQVPGNDTARNQFTSNIAISVPVVEGFEGTSFPPTGWRVINPDAGVTWTRTTTAAKTGTASSLISMFNYPAGVGQFDYLRSPLVNLNNTFDSAFVSFQYAYKYFGIGYSDTLELVASSDCGVSWNSLWKRGGTQLATTTVTGATPFVPTAANWVQAIITTSSYRSGDVFFALRSKGGYGQNLYVDDINMTGKNIPDYDLTVSDIRSPAVDICDATSPVRVTVRNIGKLTVNTLKLSYTVDNGSAVITSFTGLNLARLTDTTLTLPALTNLSVGNHILKVYSSEPNGVADQAPANDTLTKIISVKLIVSAPLVEGFEGTTFPPAGWDITQQPVDAITWARTTIAGKSSLASAYINNFNYAFGDRIDNLVSPVIRYSGADSVFLKFDVSAVTYSFPGSTAIPLDTLEVLATTDCGVTFRSIYKKFGAELQTIGDANTPIADEFFPKGNYQWRKDSVNLTRILGTSSNGVRIRFKNTENFENNIFLDNINFETKVVPARLKQNGFMVTPNPFRNSFVIQHYLPPTDLRGYGVYNSVGQQVLNQAFGAGTADSYIPVNMDRFAAGVYTIKLMYTGKTVTQKLVKLN